MLIDSTLLIDFLKGKPEAVEIMHGSKGGTLYTTEVNIFEMAIGIYKEMHHPLKTLANADTVTKKLHILPLDRKSALTAAELQANLLKKGTPIQPTDCLIAGIALSHGIRQVVTKNTEDFSRIPGLSVIAY